MLQFFLTKTNISIFELIQLLRIDKNKFVQIKKY